MSCPFCASDNPSSAQFCRACGAELPRQSAGGGGADALPIGALLAGTYAVESVLGQGGFGITYCCHDQMLDRRVAIKEFFPAGCRREDAAVQPSRGLSDSHFSEARAQFLAEARLLARCHHAGIVGVHTAFEANSTAYMVMELLHGSHLSQLLDLRGGRLSEAEAVPLIERAGEALQFVHDKGLLHRDIKPENIIATDDGRVMLIDFGTAREYAQGRAQGHTIVVTPGYAPLEQYAKQAKRGAFTDVYGLAATLYHLLTGQAPPAASDRAVGVQLRPVREQNPQISASVARATEAGLETEIAKRPQSVREFLELMRAPAPNTPEKTVSSVALTPKENTTWEEADEARKTATYASPLFLPTELDAHRQMFDTTPSAPEPIKLAPQIPFPTANASIPTTSGVPVAFSMAPDPDGGVQFKSASTFDDPVKIVYWWMGAILAFVALLFFAGTNSPSTRSSSYSSPNITRDYSSPSYSSSSSNYRSTFPTSSPTRNPFTSQEAARREMESTPAILPVSTEILPISAKAPATQTKTATKSETEYPHTLQGLAQFSPDGQMVAYLDKEGVLRVWSLSKRRVVSSLPQSKSHPLAGIRFSPDAKNLVLNYQHQGARNSNDQVTVWNLAAKKSLGTLSVDPEKESLTVGSVLPDGKVLIAKSEVDIFYQQRHLLWDPRTGKQIPPLMKDKSLFSRMVFSSDGQQLATGDRTGHIRWWDARTGVQKAEQSTNLIYENFLASPFYGGADMPGDASLDDPLPVEALRFSSNGSYLASRNRMQIRVFDSKAREIGNLPVGYSAEFEVSPDGRFVVGGAGYQTFDQNLLWNVRSGQKQKLRLQGSTGRLKAWSFSPDGKQVTGLSSSPEGVSLVTWQTDAQPMAQPLAPFSGPQISSLPSPSSPGESLEALSLSNRLSATQSGQILTQSGQNLKIRRFDGSPVSSLNTGEWPVTEMAFSPDGRLIFGHSIEGKTLIWKVKSGQQIAQLADLDAVQAGNSPSPWMFGDSHKNLLFSRDNSLVARAGKSEGKPVIEVWSLQKTPRRLAALTLKQPATALGFSADSRGLVCGDKSGKLRFYDVAARKFTAETENGAAPITQLVPTEQGLAVVSRNNSVTLVTLYETLSNGSATDSATRSPKRAFLKKSQVAVIDFFASRSAPAISSDGQYVAAGLSLGFSMSSSGIRPPRGGIGIWHLPTGSLMHKLPLEAASSEDSRPDMSFIDALTFAPDNSQLLCLKSDTSRRPQQVLTWQIPPRAKPSR